MERLGNFVRIVLTVFDETDKAPFDNSNNIDSTLLCTSNTTHILTSISAPTPKLRKTPESPTPSTTKLRKKHRHRWLVHWMRSFAPNISSNKQWELIKNYVWRIPKGSSPNRSKSPIIIDDSYFWSLCSSTTSRSLSQRCLKWKTSKSGLLVIFV